MRVRTVKFDITGKRVWFPAGAYIFLFLTSQRPYQMSSLLSFLSNGYQGHSGRGVKVTTYVNLVFRLRMYGVIPPLPHGAVINWAARSKQVLFWNDISHSHFPYFSFILPLSVFPIYILIKLLLLSIHHIGLDLYSGGFHFECRPGYQLPWMRFFVVFLSASSQIPA
jgi:hypothetical protein